LVNRARGANRSATIDRFKALGAGIAVHPSAQISTLDPWLMIYYMVTGKNSSGVVVNEAQQITRMETLRVYTAENG
jgi:predicted amidohydrolase YtcJ